jgi:hypothetical protein
LNTSSETNRTIHFFMGSSLTRTGVIGEQGARDAVGNSVPVSGGGRRWRGIPRPSAWPRHAQTELRTRGRGNGGIGRWIQ